MPNLLDERIDFNQNMDWTYGAEWCELYPHRPQYQGIANTIVQLTLRERVGCNRLIGAGSVG